MSTAPLPPIPTQDPGWPALEARAEKLIARLAGLGLTLATAESCTGGLICGLLTSVSGSSAVVDRGLVTYSNRAKQELLGVSGESLAAHGAVSSQVAEEMAAGALANAGTDLAISVTGIAGPSGGSALKPVGTVHFGLAARGLPTRTFHALFDGMEREAVRNCAVCYSFDIISNFIETGKVK